MTTTTAATTRTAGLFLVRLLAAGKTRLRPAAVRQDVSKLFSSPPTGEEWEAVEGELAAAGLLTASPLRLTEPGRAQALAFLGLESLPPRSTWKTIQSRYLVPKALGVGPAAADTRNRLQGEDGLAAFLLRAHFDLPPGAQTLAKAVDALARKTLSDLAGSPQPLTLKQLKKQLPRTVTGARGGGVNGLREAVLRRWLNAPVAPPGPGPAPDGRADVAAFDLPAFAATVRALGRDSPTGRFGDNKVFISHLWRRMSGEPGLPRLDLPAFKQRLVEASLKGLLTLSRADLVEAMDPDNVRESETPYLNTFFHFVLVEKEQP
jgi:hypothetical protein